LEEKVKEINNFEDCNVPAVKIGNIFSSGEGANYFSAKPSR